MTNEMKHKDENTAVCEAFALAHQIGIAAYAIETKFDGWIVSDRKPMLRFGKVWECQSSGNKHHA